MRPHLFETRTQTKLLHMPYRGGALAINDTISGQVEAVFAVMPEAVTHVQSGRLRALGVMSPKRSPVMPQVPTMAEAGTADLNLSAWTALLASAKTPSAIIDQLNRAVAAVFDTELSAKLAEAGIEVATSTPEELRQLIARDIKLHAELVKAAGWVPHSPCGPVLWSPFHTQRSLKTLQRLVCRPVDACDRHGKK